MEPGMCFSSKLSLDRTLISRKSSLDSIIFLSSSRLIVFIKFLSLFCIWSVVREFGEDEMLESMRGEFFSSGRCSVRRLRYRILRKAKEDKRAPTRNFRKVFSMLLAAD